MGWGVQPGPKASSTETPSQMATMDRRHEGPQGCHHTAETGDSTVKTSPKSHTHPRTQGRRARWELSDSDSDRQHHVYGVGFQSGFLLSSAEIHHVVLDAWVCL